MAMRDAPCPLDAGRRSGHRRFPGAGPTRCPTLDPRQRPLAANQPRHHGAQTSDAVAREKENDR
jgi:hypothetical protein